MKCAGGRPRLDGAAACTSGRVTVPETLGIVVIGRNEGERLPRCLDSVSRSGSPVVYVDSGSTDGSLDLARERGALVLALDGSCRFTAARARNAGYHRLLRLQPGIEFVQFVDGDCELAGGWLERATRFLESHPRVAAVSGRLRERHPEATIYNRLCAIEWDAPPGQARSCGGIVMMRVEALEDTGGFDPDLIAGEEPELCVRLREVHWSVHRIDAEMATHDADITRFSQWWRRSLRSGYAYAEAAFLHGQPPECAGVHESRSIWFWGAILPVLALALAWATRGQSLLLLLLAYTLLFLKTYRSASRGRMTAADAALYAGACTLAKFPQVLGQLKFRWTRLSGRASGIIEYKSTRGARVGPSTARAAYSGSRTCRPNAADGSTGWRARAEAEEQEQPAP
jgi:GT2 family glycosyltransferase